MLCLQSAHQPKTPLLFLAINLVLSSDLNLRENSDRLKLHAVEHGGEQLKGLALVLKAIVLLSISAQVNPLPQIVHGSQMLAPMLIQHPQHHVFLDMTHDRPTALRGTDPNDLRVVRLTDGGN